MVKRTESQWRDLFEAQRDSKLNVAQFCRQHQLNAKYFSLRKRQLCAGKPMAFIKANVAAKETPNNRAINISRIRVIEIDAQQLDVETLSTVLAHVFR